MQELVQSQRRRACDLAAAGFDKADFLCAEVRSRMFERLQLIDMQPQVILDLGSGTGASTAPLQQHFPQALIVELDWSEPMLARATKASANCICADGHLLPLADASVDVVVSNLMLPGCADPAAVFMEVRRILRSPGLFLFTTLGPDSLKELRRAWAKIDRLPHVHDHDDMHIIGDVLVQAGFREPVMDVEMLTVNYREIAALATDLRSMAATNFARNRARGLTTPRQWQEFTNYLEQNRTEAGKLPVTAELITGQAWTGDPDVGVRMDDGEARFPISRLS